LPFKGFDSLVDELSRFLRLLPSAVAAALLPREVFALVRLFPVLDRVDAVASAPKKDIPDPQELRRRAFRAFGELIARIRDRRPLVLYIDDAQWLDRDSVAFLRALLVHGEPVPALAILSYRSEEADQNPLLQDVFEAARGNSMLEVRSMRVGPLTLDAAEQLAGRWFRGKDATLAESVAREARGSPFFVAALARHAARSESRGWLPAISLATALADQLAELSAESRRVLEVMALAGRPLPMLVVIDAASSTRADLDALQRMRLVRTSGGELLETVECYHDRIREAVGGGLSDAASRAHYAALAQVLEVRVDADTELLARCFEGSGQMALAAVYAERAGDKAVAATAFEHAASLFRRALAAGGHAGAAHHALSLKLADALAEAGKGPEAAEIYRRCAAETSGAESIDLRRKAAEQLVTCGQMSEGEALLRDVCREVGVRIAATPGQARLSLALSQLRVRVTKLEFEPLTQGSVSAAVKLRLDCHFSVMKSLTAHAPIIAASTGDQWLLDALRARERDHVARALTAQLYNYSLSSSVDERRLAQLVEAAERATGDPGIPEVRGLLLMAIGSADNNLGRWTSARPVLARALEVLRGKCRGTAWETDAVLFQDQIAAFQRGDLSDIARTGPAAIEESFRRGRLLAGALLSGCFGLPARLVHDDVPGARVQLDEALARWVPQAEMLAADYMLWLGEATLSLYQGDPAAASARLDARESAYRRTMLTHVGWLRVHFLAARGGSALALLRTRHGTRALRNLARSCSQKLARERLPYAPFHALALEAGVALADGHGEQAIPLLRRSIDGFESCGMHACAAAVQRRLGQLLGGDERVTHIAASDAFFRGQGVKNPDAMTEMLVPGCGHG
jgi:hypothetical protein